MINPKIRVSSSGEEYIFVRYTPAKDKSDKPLVIEIHGLASSMDSLHNMSITRAFQKNNFPTLQIDTRCSNSNGSSGQLKNFEIGEHVNDIITASNWVEEAHLDWLAGKKIILAGHSMGGLSVLEAGATMLSNKISAIFSVSSVASGEQFIQDLGETARRSWENGTHTEPKTGDYNKTSGIDDRNWEEWRTHNAFNFASKIKVPVFGLVGELDNVTPAAHTEKLMKQIGGNLTILKGADHCLRDKNSDVVTQQLEVAIAKQLATLNL